MTDPTWATVLMAVLLGIPVLAMLGAVLTFAVGGLMGCSECLFARMGAVRMSPGVVSIKRHGVATPIG